MGESSTDNLRFIEDVLLETKDEKDVYLIENEREKKIGSTTETVKFIFVDGREAIEREQTLTSKVLGNRKGITIVEKSSFKPISSTSYLNDNQKAKKEEKLN